MYVFGEIDKSSTIIESNVVNYTQNLTTASVGIQSIKIVSGSINNDYWNSLNVLFYTSGSGVYPNEHKFSAPTSNLSIDQIIGKQYLTKYHGYPSSSMITIPSSYYGEKIKEGSFTFTDLNNPDNSGNNPIIRDDGKGNLYSTNAHHSQSTSAASSSGGREGRSCPAQRHAERLLFRRADIRRSRLSASRQTVSRSRGLFRRRLPCAAALPAGWCWRNQKTAYRRRWRSPRRDRSSTGSRHVPWQAFPPFRRFDRLEQDRA